MTNTIPNICLFKAQNAQHLCLMKLIVSLYQWRNRVRNTIDYNQTCSFYDYYLHFCKMFHVLKQTKWWQEFSRGHAQILEAVWRTLVWLKKSTYVCTVYMIIHHWLMMMIGRNYVHVPLCLIVISEKKCHKVKHTKKCRIEINNLLAFR